MSKANCKTCNDVGAFFGITSDGTPGSVPCPACGSGETFKPVVTHATSRPSITLAPGALDDVPLLALIRFLGDHGLELHRLTIERAE